MNVRKKELLYTEEKELLYHFLKVCWKLSFESLILVDVIVV